MPRVSIAPEASLATEINVLPLIDVLLVMIVIFMVMNLPIHYIPAQIPAPVTAPGLNGGGQIVLELREDGGYAINGQPLPRDQVVDGLRAIYTDRPTKLLFIRAADNRSYGDVVAAMDAARESGVQSLAWVPSKSPRATGPDRRPH
jgi:biopolymer transport protein ExbD